MFTRKITVTGTGTTSATDALVVRNSALQNVLRIRDDRQVIIDVGGTGGALSMYANSNRFELLVANLRITSGGNALDFTSGLAGTFTHLANQTFRNTYNDDRGVSIQVGDQNQSPYLSFRNGRNIYFTDTPNTSIAAHSFTLFQKSGTPPSASLTDCIAMYSADVIAGNAAPHFRTEAGHIIKLYRQDTSVTSASIVSP